MLTNPCQLYRFLCGGSALQSLLPSALRMEIEFAPENRQEKNGTVVKSTCVKLSAISLSIFPLCSLPAPYHL